MSIKYLTILFGQATFAISVKLPVVYLLEEKPLKHSHSHSLAQHKTKTMDDEEFVLDCDSVSNFSSISGCTFAYDLLSVTSDYTSLEESEMFEVEMVEELLNDDSNYLQNAFVANISGNRTIMSEDEYTFETFVTDDDDSDMASASSFEVASETEREDDCENDSHDDNVVGSLNQFNLVTVAVEPSTVHKGSSVLEKNDKLQRAKVRRAEALKRCNDVLNNGSSSSFAAGSLPIRSEFTKGQESLKDLVSAIEAMGDAEILASATAHTTHTAKKASLASRTSAAKRRSLIELRARQQESLKGLINAFDALLRDTKVQSQSRNYCSKPRSAAPTTTQPIFTCV